MKCACPYALSILTTIQNYQVNEGNLLTILFYWQIAYFLEPSHDCIVECLPTCYSETNPPKYVREYYSLTEWGVLKDPFLRIEYQFKWKFINNCIPRNIGYNGQLKVLLWWILLVGTLQLNVRIIYPNSIRILIVTWVHIQRFQNCPRKRTVTP